MLRSRYEVRERTDRLHEARAPRVSLDLALGRHRFSRPVRRTVGARRRGVMIRVLGWHL
jgi:hypothetical protein